MTLATERATATALCSFEMTERQLLEIRGTAGTISVSRPYTPSVEDDHYTIEHVDGSLDRVVTGGADPYRLMLEAFARSCRGHAEWPRGQVPTLAMVGKIIEILSMTANSAAATRPRD